MSPAEAAEAAALKYAKEKEFLDCRVLSTRRIGDDYFEVIISGQIKPPASILHRPDADDMLSFLSSINKMKLRIRGDEVEAANFMDIQLSS